MNAFTGFTQPKENWSKLPHEFIDLLPDMKERELKVTVYILRHTWGYQEYDTPKAITTDEFLHGRKDKNGRMDRGCGLSSKTSVIEGIRDGIRRGTIIEVLDDHDKARVKKAYRPSRPEDFAGVQNMDAAVQNLDTGGSEFEQRTEKETVERNTGKKDSAADAGGASSSQKNAHSSGDATSTKKARPRDVVFDAVVAHCFDTDPFNALEVQQLGGGRIGRIVKALRKAYAGVLEDEQLADELGMFAEAWAKELTMPQHEDSLLPNFKKWRDGNAGTPAQVARAMNQPIRVRASCDDPACKGGYVKTAQGRELCGNCWEVPDKVTA